MNKLGRNTVANVMAKLWSMISIYLFIPLYIQILGETSYGLVSFFATLQTTLNILGLGLSNTLRREFASGEQTESNAIRKYKLLRSVESIYFLIAFSIILLCVLGAGGISKYWLQIETLDTEMVEIVLSLMGISIALQLVANLYAGCLFGLEYQVLANIMCVIWSAAKSVGAWLCIRIVSPDLVCFYCWHIFTDAVYLIFLRFFSVRKLKIKQKIRWKLRDLSNLKSIWKYTCGILFISFVVMVNKHLYKIIISKYLPLTELGAYNIATTLGSVSTIFPLALYTTVFPRFTNHATTGNMAKLEQEFLKINKISGLVLSAMGCFIAVYALPLIQVWTGSISYVDILGSVGTLVVLAVSVAEFQEIPYALALANGNTKYNVLVGGVFIPIVFFFTYIGVANYGLMGAGAVYFIMMASQTLVYEWLVYRRYLLKNPIRMIWSDTIIPMGICLAVAFISKAVIEMRDPSPGLESIFAVGMGGLTLILLLFIFMKKDLIDFLKKYKGERR